MTVHLEHGGAVAALVLDRPDAGNRLDHSTLDELRAGLRSLAVGDDAPAVVVLRANGPDFSLGREPATSGPPTPDGLEAEFALVQEVNELVQHHPAVTVAAVRGQACGAALSLAARCDLVVAGRGSRLSFPEVPHGIPPTIVLSHYRYVLPSKVLADLIFTGRELSGAEALAANLVSHVVDDDDVDERAMGLAAQIATQDRRTLRVVKRFLARSEGLDPRDAPALGIAMFANEMVDRALADEAGRDHGD